jgi:hypothetical protein
MSKGQRRQKRPKSHLRSYVFPSVKLFPPKVWRFGRMALRPGKKCFGEILLVKAERPMNPPPMRNIMNGSVIVFYF